MSIHKESLCLDSLEDFNATEVDIMCLKESILSMWKSRDVQGKLRPSDPHSFPLQTPGVGDPPWGKSFTPGQPVPSSSVPRGPGGGGDAIATSSLALQTFGPTTQDSHSSWTVPLPSRSNACQLSCDGSACRVQLRSHHGMAPQSINP